MNEFLFKQRSPFERLALLRCSMALVCIGLLYVGPYNLYYADSSAFMYEARFPFYGFPDLGQSFHLAKGVTYCLAVLYGLGVRLKWTAPLFTASWLLLNYYTFCFHQQWDVEHSHLNFFLLIMLSVDCGRHYAYDPQNSSPTDAEREWASFVIAALQIYVVMLYFQAGVSKLVSSGWSWFSTGDTIYVKGILEGTDFARYLTHWPILFPLQGYATAAFEFGAPLLFFWRRTRPYFPLMAFGFHMGTYSVLKISFWFLWTLFPALFYWRAGTEAHSRVPIKAPA